jgi:hypothetical protein
MGLNGGSVATDSEKRTYESILWFKTLLENCNFEIFWPLHFHAEAMSYNVA